MPKSFFSEFGTGFFKAGAAIAEDKSKKQDELDKMRQEAIIKLSIEKELEDYKANKDLANAKEAIKLSSPVPATVDQTPSAIAGVPTSQPSAVAATKVMPGVTGQVDDSGIPADAPTVPQGVNSVPNQAPPVNTVTPQSSAPASQNEVMAQDQAPQQTAVITPVNSVQQAPSPAPATNPHPPASDLLAPDPTIPDPANAPEVQERAKQAREDAIYRTKGSIEERYAAGREAATKVFEKARDDDPATKAQKAFAEKKVTYGIMVQQGADPDAAKEQIFGKSALSSAELGQQDSEDIQARVNLGLLKELPKRSLNPSQQKDVDTLVSKANDARVASIQGINTMNSVLGISADLTGGPFANAQAKVEAAFGQMTDTQVADTINQIYVLNKDQIQATNAQMKALGNVRPGIGIATLEKAGTPGSDMPREARIEVANQMIAQFRANINHADAITSGPSDRISAPDRIKMANEHDDANPAILGDGKTPNPSFVDFKTWRGQVAKGTWNQNTTGNDVRGAGGEVKSTAKESNSGWKYIGVVK